MEKTLRQHSAEHLVKVVLIGPESSGKTTLSRQLAAYYNTVWVAEYARDYLQQKWDKHRKTWDADDLLPIAYGQIHLENEMVVKANKVLICDTDILATKVYSEQYYDGYVDERLHNAVTNTQYDMYFLTYIDTPWVADDLRDRPKPEQRLQMFHAFEQALIEHNRPYTLLKGDKQTRLNKAIEVIDELLKNLHANLDSVK